MSNKMIVNPRDSLLGFLKQMAEYYQELCSGVPYTVIMARTVQSICDFLARNLDLHDIQMALRFVSRLYEETLSSCNDDGSSFAREYLICLSAMEKMLRGSGDPIPIIQEVLKGVLEFYDADSIAIIETNTTAMSGKLAMEVSSNHMQSKQRYNTVFHIDGERMPALYHAVMHNETVSLDMASGLLSDFEQEKMLSTHVEFAAIAPFQKRKSGYVLLTNPHKWRGCNELLQAASYVIVAELNESDLLNELVIASDLNRSGPHDIYFDCFDKLNVRTCDNDHITVKVGSLPFRLVVYLVMHRKRKVAQDELIKYLWENPDELTDVTNNLRQQVHKARKYLDTIYPYPFIVCDMNNNYSIDSSVKLHLDTEAFVAYYAAGRRASSIDESLENYQKAYEIYKGDLLTDTKNDSNIEYRRTHYVMEFMKLIMDYLPLLMEVGNYSMLSTVASRGLRYEPDNSSFHYYYLMSMIHQGFYDLAASHLKKNKEHLRENDLVTIKFLLKNH